MKYLFDYLQKQYFLKLYGLEVVARTKQGRLNTRKGQEIIESYHVYKGMVPLHICDKDLKFRPQWNLVRF